MSRAETRHIAGRCSYQMYRPDTLLTVSRRGTLAQPPMRAYASAHARAAGGGLLAQEASTAARGLRRPRGRLRGLRRLALPAQRREVPWRADRSSLPDLPAGKPVTRPLHLRRRAAPVCRTGSPSARSCGCWPRPYASSRSTSSRCASAATGTTWSSSSSSARRSRSTRRRRPMCRGGSGEPRRDERRSGRVRVTVSIDRVSRRFMDKSAFFRSVGCVRGIRHGCPPVGPRLTALKAWCNR